MNQHENWTQVSCCKGKCFSNVTYHFIMILLYYRYLFSNCANIPCGLTQECTNASICPSTHNFLVACLFFTIYHNIFKLAQQNLSTQQFTIVGIFCRNLDWIIGYHLHLMMLFHSRYIPYSVT